MNWRALQPLVSGEHERRVVGGLHLLMRERRRRLRTVENLSVSNGDLRGQRGFSKEQLVIAICRHKTDLQAAFPQRNKRQAAAFGHLVKGVCICKAGSAEQRTE